MYINMDVTRGKVWIQGKHFLFISLVMIFAGSAQAGIEWGGDLNGHFMAISIRKKINSVT